MEKEFKLSPKDKETLLKWGYIDDELKQIEDATNNGDFYSHKGNKISWLTAKKILGNECFLSGIARASFHWTTIRYNEKNNNNVEFDYSVYFQKLL